MDMGEIIVRKVVGLESGYCNTDDVELVSPRNNGVDKVIAQSVNSMVRSDNTAKPQSSPSIRLHIRVYPYFHGAICAFN